MPDQVKVVGLKTISRDMARISKQLPLEMRKITKAAAQTAAEQTRAMAPVKTGRLRNTVKVGATNNGAYIQTGGSLPYTKPIIFGWRRHNIQANPFPYRAVEAARPVYHEQVQHGLDELFRTIGGPE